MNKTLRLSFSLQNAYRVNTILYAIKQIPLLKRLLPDSLYACAGLKIFGQVLAVLWEIGTFFLGKFLYFLTMVVGVGVGGTMDYAAYLAKRALCRPLDSENENEQYRQLERECLEQINQLNIGPMGLKGRTTALKVNIEWFPTHIAGMPVAVNINCHVTRHKKVVL